MPQHGLNPRLARSVLALFTAVLLAACSATPEFGPELAAQRRRPAG